MKKKVKADNEVIVSLAQLEKVKCERSKIAKRQLNLESKVRQLEKISSEISQISALSEK